MAAPWENYQQASANESPWVKYQPNGEESITEKPSPSFGHTASLIPESFNLGLAKTLDVALNAPANIANLGVSGAGLAALALNRPELASKLAGYVQQAPNYAQRAFEAIGATHPDITPQSSGERILSSGMQGVGGSLVGPFGSLGSLVRTAAISGGAGGTGQAVTEATGSQLAGALASMAVPFGPGTLTRPVARGAANVLGFTTGAGGKAIKEAANAGFTGGKAAEAFRENISDRANSLDVVNEAKNALNEIRADRANAYNSGMVDIKSDATVLDMKPILAKVDEVRSRGIFKGKVKNESASKTWEEIDAAVKDWNTSSPADFHTPEGLDALKQRIGDIRDSQQIGTPSYNAAKEVYNAVKEQIAAQAPTYSKVMRDYTDASELISQMEGALSLGNKAQADTALRKLQSLLRNNVQTNYGRRDELGQILAGKGATTLYPALAGQALNSMMPRSMSGINSATGVGLAGILSAKALPMMAMTSPRLMGEAAYGAGKIAGVPNRMATALMRGGKLSQTTGMNRDQLAAALATMGAVNAGQQ